MYKSIVKDLVSRFVLNEFFGFILKHLVELGLFGKGDWLCLVNCPNMLYILLEIRETILVKEKVRRFL